MKWNEWYTTPNLNLWYNLASPKKSMVSLVPLFEIMNSRYFKLKSLIVNSEGRPGLGWASNWSPQITVKDGVMPPALWSPGLSLNFSNMVSVLTVEYMGIIQSKWGKTPVKGTIYSDWFAWNVPFFWWLSNITFRGWRWSAFYLFLWSWDMSLANLRW